MEEPILVAHHPGYRVITLNRPQRLNAVTEAMQTDAMKDLDGIIRDAIKLKFIDRPLTKEQLAELIQIPPR